MRFLCSTFEDGIAAVSVGEHRSAANTADVTGHTPGRGGRRGGAGRDFRVHDHRWRYVRRLHPDRYPHGRADPNPAEAGASARRTGRCANGPAGCIISAVHPPGPERQTAAAATPMRSEGKTSCRSDHRLVVPTYYRRRSRYELSTFSHCLSWTLGAPSSVRQCWVADRSGFVTNMLPRRTTPGEISHESETEP